LRVGFIGLGRMGRAMSQSLVRGGHEVVVHNRTPGRAGDLVEAGAREAGSIAEACEGREAVLTMVADDAALMEVTNALREALPDGAVPVAMGTHGVGAIKSAAAAHAEAVKNSLFPGTALEYLVGTDAIHRLRRDLAARPGFELGAFHDRLLAHGSIPVTLAAAALCAKPPCSQP
jgi:pyrroline-5-carboxylate reductase